MPEELDNKTAAGQLVTTGGAPDTWNTLEVPDQPARSIVAAVQHKEICAERKAGVGPLTPFPERA